MTRVYNLFIIGLFKRPLHIFSSHALVMTVHILNALVMTKAYILSIPWAAKRVNNSIACTHSLVDAPHIHLRQGKCFSYMECSIFGDFLGPENWHLLYYYVNTNIFKEQPLGWLGYIIRASVDPHNTSSAFQRKPTTHTLHHTIHKPHSRATHYTTQH